MTDAQAAAQANGAAAPGPRPVPFHLPPPAAPIPEISAADFSRLAEAATIIGRNAGVAAEDAIRALTEAMGPLQRIALQVRRGERCLHEHHKHPTASARATCAQLCRAADCDGTTHACAQHGRWDYLEHESCRICAHDTPAARTILCRACCDAFISHETEHLFAWGFCDACLDELGTPLGWERRRCQKECGRIFVSLPGAFKNYCRLCVPQEDPPPDVQHLIWSPDR